MPRQYLASLAIVVAAILWSFDGLIRQNLFEVPAITIVTIEHVLGLLLFTPFLIRGWQSIKSLDLRGWASVGWVAAFGGLAGTFLYTKALGYVGFIDLSVVVLLQKLQPVFAIALAALLLREPITKRFLGFAVAAMLGGYLLTFPTGLPDLSIDGNHVAASMLAVGAAFAWGSSTVMGKYALRSVPFFTLSALRMLATSAIAIPILLAMEGPSLALKQDDWLFLVAIVLSTGSVAVFIYYYGLQRVPASHATLYELFWPLSAVLIDWGVYDKVLGPTQMLGGAMLIVVSIGLSRGPRTRDQSLITNH